ncbi:MAG: hypothetical protein K2N87_13705 [Eubacterium sp.]|nr:hypothetical protein [Eubacterium sp.]
MNGVNEYRAVQGSYYNSAFKNSTSAKAGSSRKASGTQSSQGRKELSDKAQALLEKLKKTHSNMDFMVADKGDNTKEVLSRGTKEFSVLFSTEELEKMAADETFEKENMDKVYDAVRMTEQINKENGFGPASEKGEILKIGISFNDDGTTSYFAELEKMSESQRERIEKAKEQKKDLKDISVRSKRTQVSASSMKELVEKMNKVDWSKIREQDIKNYQPGFDFSI